MPIERLALLFAIVVAVLYMLVTIAHLMAFGPIAAFSAVAVLGAAGYLFVRVLRERLASRDDDHYDKNVHL